MATIEEDVPPPSEPTPKRGLNIDRTEQFFIGAGVILLVLSVIAVVLTMNHGGTQLIEPVGRIDPAEVTTTPPFDNPGLRQVGDNEYEAVMIGQAWQWVPEEITVPKGATVTFIMTTVDVIHGFRVPDTALNAMLIPGQISQVEATFDEEGTYSVICHEYCGIGHHNMGGRIVVEG